MNRSIQVAWTFLTVSFLAGLALAQTPASPKDQLNVTAFGAQGDGTSDDTAAIQKALDAAVPRCQGDRPKVRHNARRDRLSEFLELPPNGGKGRVHRDGRWPVLHG